MTQAVKTMPVQRLTLLRIALAALVASLIVNFVLRALGIVFFGVPSDLPPLTVGLLIISTVIPILGNTFGFFMSYRKPYARALLMFLIPGFILTVGGLTKALTSLPAGVSTASILVTIVVNLVPTTLVVLFLFKLGRPQEKL